MNAEQNTQKSQVAAILRRLNPNDPSGQWSVYDVAEKLNGHPPDDGEYAEAERMVRELCPNGGRYVGGTSGYLFNL